MTLRILVTGASGFIGSHCVTELLRAQHQVVALNEYNSFGNIGWLEEVHGNFELVSGDVRDKEFIENVISDVDCVINLAALIAIPHSFDARRSYFETNTMGTLNIAESIIGTEKRLIHVSTSEVYGTPDSVPITEKHKINPQSPYAASKAAADNLISSYWHAFDMNALIIRPFNTFGPRQSLRAIIPTVIGQLLGPLEEIRVGSLTPKRDFTFVTDTVRALRLAAESSESKKVIQLGTGSSISVGDLIETLQKILRTEKRIEVDEKRIRPNNSEVEVLISDPSLAKEFLGWESTVDLESGLIQTVEWLKEHNDYFLKSTQYNK